MLPLADLFRGKHQVPRPAAARWMVWAFGGAGALDDGLIRDAFAAAGLLEETATWEGAFG